MFNYSYVNELTGYFQYFAITNTVVMISLYLCGYILHMQYVYGVISYE